MQGEDDLVRKISSWIRGLSDVGKSNLALALGDCDGLTALAQKVHRLARDADEKNPVGNHRDFHKTWFSTLGARVTGLMAPYVAPSEDGDDASQPGQALTPDILLSGSDPEEPEDDPVEVWEPVSDDPLQVTPMVRRSRSLADKLRGRGIHDLLRDPDSILPLPLGKEIWERAAKAGEAALAKADLEEAERHLTHLLAIETGLAEGEVELTMFCGNTDGGVLAIDLADGVLRRPEVRPPSAFEPKKEDRELWAAVGGDILMPLSPRLQNLLGVLREKRIEQLTRNAGLLIASQQDPRKALRAALAEVWPRGSLSTTRYRLRIAAGLAAELGPDVAQLVFGETFGSSAAPTYYAGHSAGDLHRSVLRLNAPITSVAPAGPVPELGADHLLGSRVRPSNQPFAEAWQQMGSRQKRSRGRPRIGGLLGDLRRERDCLAVHFGLGTGQRPSQRMAEFSLADLLPAAAMALVRDKQSDPARLTRLVATGWKFIGAVEAYIASLRLIRRRSEFAFARKAIEGVLRSELPLFTTILDDGRTEPLDVADLYSRLPAPWRDRPNLHRHALNHGLTRARVDPEARYFQMGWIATDAHAVSEVAPYPPISLGPELAPVIDEWLDSIGWNGGSRPKDPDSVHADIPLWDYDKSLQAHVDEHTARFQKLRSELSERRERVLPEVIQILSKTLNKEEPRLQLEQLPGSKGVRLARAAPGVDVTINADLVDALLAPFQGREPIQGHLAATVLTGILWRAAKAKLCEVRYLPRLVRLGPAGQPSPFISGVGLATTHARAIREGLLEIMKRLDAEPEQDRVGIIATVVVLAIASHTQHRTFKQSFAIAKALRSALRSNRQPWLLRVPFGAGHVALSGIPTLLYTRVTETPGVAEAVDGLATEGRGRLGQFLLDKMPGLFGGLSPRQAEDRLFQTLRVAASVELEGPQRLILQGLVEPATVSPCRAASADDGLSIGVGSDSPSGPEGPDPDPEDAAPAPSRAKRSPGRPKLALRNDLRRIMPAFNPDYAGEIGGQPADPPAVRPRQLRSLLRAELEKMDPEPLVARLVLEFVLHLLDERSGKMGVGLAISTIYGKYNRLTRVIDAMPANKSMVELDEEDVTAALLMGLQATNKMVRPDLLADAEDFLRFAALRCGVALPDWGRVRSVVEGGRVRGSDPAIVTDQEAARIIDCLKESLDGPPGEARDPIEQRYRELLLGSGLLLEASNARPRSIYGLTLADIYLSDKGDFLHLKASGRFASIKTRTSAGFLRLEGALWLANREWFVAWYARLVAAVGDPTLLAETPLFQEPGAPQSVRYPLSAITSRIGELVRWGTRQRSGRTYWLRKRRICFRHADARRKARPRARDVAQAMRASGHVLINTPIASYLGDPSTYINPMGAGIVTSLRPVIAAYSGLGLNRLDQRWHRRSRRGGKPLSANERLSELLPASGNAWSEGEWAPPPPYRPYQSGLTWRAIARAIPEMAKPDLAPDDLMVIAEETGLGTHVLSVIRESVGELCLRTAIDPRVAPDLLSEPRKTKATSSIARLVDVPDVRLQKVASEWVSSALVLPNEPDCVLVSAKHASILGEILEAAGVEAKIGRSPRGASIIELSSDGKKIYGSWPVLRWVLSVAWTAWRTEQLLSNGAPN
ncbi:hypothetical protein K3217_21135 [bacterium BD-1]|nr:hypothetical protein [Ottowia caeni]